MIVSIHQPAYLPWLGYFHKILRSDVFVLLDTVQLEKNGYTNRNRIRTPSGVQWLTIPLRMKGHTGKTIGEMEINTAVAWMKKHIRTLEQAYGKRPFYPAHAPEVEALIDAAGGSLLEFLRKMLSHFLETLGMAEKKIILASELEAKDHRSELLLAICREIGADAYLSGAGGRDYLDVKLFEDVGVEVFFQDFRHPEYDQGYADFAPSMCILDSLFNIGAEETVKRLAESGGMSAPA
ncbi:MAG: WbqC family protein [bacterium]|nr:WbqC family protein [bacterium]